MKRKVTLIVAAVGLIVFSAAAIQFTSNPSFCSSCHSISPLVSSWEESSHNEVNCLACHAEPGAVGLIKRKAYGLRELYVHVTDPEAVPKAQSDTWAFSQRCLDCHEEVHPEREDQVAALSHNKRHFEMEMSCITCHVGIVHNEDEYNPIPSREICLTCHSTTFQ